MSETYRIDKSSLFHKMPHISAVVGVLCLGLFGFLYAQHPERAAFSYLFAYFSVLGVALGCLGFVIIQHVTRTGWSIVVRRIAEVSIATMPLFVVLFIPVLIFSHYLFPWMHVEDLDKILVAKTPYLNFNFFVVRSVCYLAVWVFLGLYFYTKSVAQDSRKNSESSRALWKMSAPGVILFGMTLTFASFDWLMSLQPHWYSTIFGIYIFSGSLLTGLAFMTLIVLALQNGGYLKFVNQEHYHDLGKLMFGFTVFWAYIAFSQFMLIWYAGIPEEAEFYLHRLHHGWGISTWLMPITHFFIPFFFLMSRHVKKIKWALAIACVYLILVQFFNIYWIVMPNVGAHSGHPAHFHIELMDIAGVVGVFALFLAYVTYLLTRVDIVASGDPRLQESINFENF